MGRKKQKQPRNTRNSRKLNGDSCADIVLLPSQGLPSAIVFVRIPQESAPELICWKQVTCTGAFSCGIRTKTMQREALAPGWAAERYPHLPMLVPCYSVFSVAAFKRLPNFFSGPASLRCAFPEYPRFDDGLPGPAGSKSMEIRGDFRMPKKPGHTIPQRIPRFPLHISTRPNGVARTNSWNSSREITTHCSRPK